MAKVYQGEECASLLAGRRLRSISVREKLDGSNGGLERQSRFRLPILEGESPLCLAVQGKCASIDCVLQKGGSERKDGSKEATKKRKNGGEDLRVRATCGNLEQTKAP